MSRIRKFATTLRTHWKKSTFGALVAGYAGNYAYKKHQDNLLMTEYCKEALSYGEASCEITTPAYHVTVILNPAAGGAKGRSKFENYCEPLLHLAGIKVSTVRTEAQGQAKEIMEIAEKTDAVLIAGGDGTLMETITGLMRRQDYGSLAKDIKLGVLPVGANNMMAKQLFPGCDTEVKRMAEATMAVVRQLYRPVDVMEVENISTDERFAGKKIYGFRQIQVGFFKDAKNRVDKFWYLPFVKRYLTYFFSYYSSSPSIIRSCDGSLEVGWLQEQEQEEEEPVVVTIRHPQALFVAVMAAWKLAGFRNKNRRRKNQLLLNQSLDPDSGLTYCLLPRPNYCQLRSTFLPNPGIISGKTLKTHAFRN